MKSPQNNNKRGKNVWILLEFLRHAEPGENVLTKEGELEAIEYGKKIGTDVDMIKAYSSSALRAKMTRDIILEQLKEAADKLGVPRDETPLGYETIEMLRKFPWEEFRKRQLPKDFDKLGREEQRNVNQKAETLTVREVLKDKKFTAEAASHMSYIVEKYFRMAGRLNSNSKVKLLKITHNSLLMSFLKETFWRKDQNGNHHVGFKDLDEIGGSFSPMECLRIIIRTDKNGESRIDVHFVNTERFKGIEYEIDLERIKSLSFEYKRNKITRKVKNLTPLQ